MLTPKFDEPRFNEFLQEYRTAESLQTEREALNRCIVAAEPLLQIAMLGIHARDYDEMDELKQAGRRGFWKSLQSHPESLRAGYLVQKARWTMYDWIKSKPARREQFSFGWLGLRHEDILGRFEGFRAVEDRIYLDEMRQITLDRFVVKCRFDGADYEVCVRIARAIIWEEEISKRQLDEIGCEFSPNWGKDFATEASRSRAPSLGLPVPVRRQGCRRHDLCYKVEVPRSLANLGSRAIVCKEVGPSRPAERVVKCSGIEEQQSQMCCLLGSVQERFVRR